MVLEIYHSGVLFWLLGINGRWFVRMLLVSLRGLIVGDRWGCGFLKKLVYGAVLKGCSIYYLLLHIMPIYFFFGCIEYFWWDHQHWCSGINWSYLYSWFSNYQRTHGSLPLFSHNLTAFKTQLCISYRTRLHQYPHIHIHNPL